MCLNLLKRITEVKHSVSLENLKPKQMNVIQKASKFSIVVGHIGVENFFKWK